MFVQNAVQLRSLLIMECEDEDGSARAFQSCFTTRHKVMFVLITISLVVQTIYAGFILAGKMILNFINCLSLMNSRTVPDETAESKSSLAGQAKEPKRNTGSYRQCIVRLDCSAAQYFHIRFLPFLTGHFPTVCISPSWTQMRLNRIC